MTTGATEATATEVSTSTSISTNTSTVRHLRTTPDLTACATRPSSTIRGTMIRTAGRATARASPSPSTLARRTITGITIVEAGAPGPRRGIRTDTEDGAMGRTRRTTAEITITTGTSIPGTMIERIDPAAAPSDVGPRVPMGGRRSIEATGAVRRSRQEPLGDGSVARSRRPRRGVRPSIARRRPALSKDGWAVPSGPAPTSRVGWGDRPREMRIGIARLGPVVRSERIVPSGSGPGPSTAPRAATTTEGPRGPTRAPAPGPTTRRTTAIGALSTGFRPAI